MHNQSPEEEIRALRQEGQRHHQHGQHYLALQCYQKAIPLALPLGNAGLMALLLSEAGGEHRDCDNYHHAADLLLAALSLLPNHEETIPLRASIKKALAIAFRDIFGPYKEEVLQLLEESRSDYVYLNKEGMEANVLQHIALVYIARNRYAEADSLLQEALRKAQVAEDEQLIGWILDDMADVQMAQNDWGTALELGRQARRYAVKVGDKEAEGDTWITEGRVFLCLNHTDAALSALQKALSLYSENKNLRRTIHARREMANVLVQLHCCDEAIEILHTALSTAAHLDLRREQALLRLRLGKIELIRKNIGLASEHAARARGVADEEKLLDIFNDAEDLLRQCCDEESRHE